MSFWDSSHERGWRFFVVVATAFLAFFPLLYVLPGPTPDDGWIDVLGEAHQRGWIFGRDIVFNEGPLSALFTGYFVDGDFYLILGLRCILVATLARLLWLLLSDAAAALLIAAAALLSGPIYERPLTDPLFIALPLLFALAILDAPGHRLDALTLSLGVVSTALLGLAKFTTTALAVPTFLLLDGRAILQRRLPLLTIGYLIATACIFAALEGGLSGFSNYLYYSAVITAGYGDAMSSEISNSHFSFAFLLIAAAGTGLIIGESIARRHGSAPLGPVLLRLSIMGLFLFLAWKAGFVRHDKDHEPTAWAALALLGILELAAKAPIPQPRRGRTFLLAISMLSLVTAILFGTTVRLRDSGIALAGDIVFAADRIVDTVRFIAAPAAWFAARRDEKAAAWANIRAAVPVPAVSGSVDAIPSIQSALIAHGLDYRPRLTLQEYTDYSQPLIEASRHSLIETTGPETLLVRPGSIDERYPSLAEGPLWPEILTHFRPTELADDMVVMRRRERVLPDLLGAATTGSAALGETVLLPPEREGVYISLALRKTVLGAVLSLLFKSDFVMIDVETASGVRHTHRLIPGIAEAGFVLSPYVATAHDFIALAHGLGGNDAPEAVKSFRIREERPWSLFSQPLLMFRTEFTYEERYFDLAPLRMSAAKGGE